MGINIQTLKIERASDISHPRRKTRKVHQVKTSAQIIVFTLLFLSPCHFFPFIADGETAEPLPFSQVRYWAYQIQNLDAPGAVDDLMDSPYDMIVVDPTVTSEYGFNAKDMIQKIKNSKAHDRFHRKLVMAYIDIGEAEEWRWYWDDHPTYEQLGECRLQYVTQIQTWAPWVVACDPDGWAGNYPVAFWDSDWKDIVINGTALGSGLDLYFASMLDEVIKDGFDGVYIDWVEAWEMSAVRVRAQKEGKDPAQEMLKLIKEIRAYGRAYNPGFLVIQQNSSQLIFEVGASALFSAVDAIAQEGVWWDGAATDDWNDPEGYDKPSGNEDYYLPRLRAYKAAGLPVFVCEYALENAEDAYKKAKSEGFLAYVTRTSLSKLTTTPPNFASPCPDCSGNPVVLTNVTFISGTSCECVNETSITIGPGVTVEAGATVVFRAPKVIILNGAHFKNAAVVEIRQE